MNRLEIITQLIGFIGAGFAVASFQSRKHGTIMILKTISEAVFSVQLILLGAFTGVAMNCIGSIRNLVFAGRVSKGKSTKPFIVVFSVITVILGMLTWSGPVSALAITAKLITTCAYGMKNATLVRRFTIPSCLCWVVYNVLIRSFAGILTETFSLISIGVAEIRRCIGRHETEKKLKPSGRQICD